MNRAAVNPVRRLESQLEQWRARLDDRLEPENPAACAATAAPLVLTMAAEHHSWR